MTFEDLAPEKTLETRRVILLPLDETHTVALSKYAYDPRLWSLTTIAVRDREELEEYISNALSAKQARTAIPYVIHSKERDEIIGTTRYHSLNLEHGRVEIGFTWITPDLQRQGLNREVKLAMIDNAFDLWNFNRVEFKADSENLPSRFAMEALGAEHEATLRHYMHSSRKGWRDVAVYGLVASDWPQKRLNLMEKLNR